MSLFDVLATILSLFCGYGRVISMILGLFTCGLAFHFGKQVEIYGLNGRFLETAIVIWTCLILGYISKKCVQIDLQNE